MSSQPTAPGAYPSGAPGPESIQAMEMRPARMDDVEGIFELIQKASRTSTVLPRTRDSICENMRDYVIGVLGGRIVACGAVHIWGVDLAELRSLVVDPSMRGRGAGGRLVGALVEYARELRLKRLFVLTDSVEFFQRQGFAETDRATLPHKVWNECILCPKFEDCGEVSLDLKLGRPEN